MSYKLQDTSNPQRYKGLPGAPLVYDAICRALSDRADQFAWEALTPIHWRLFPAMAVREGVAPLLYYAFKDGKAPDGCLEPVFNALKTEYYNTLANNTLLFQELERVLAALEAAGIPVIVLKGAALAATVYENIGLRPMGDLDLLVKKEQLDSAASVMDGLGFEQEIIELQTGNQGKFGHHINYKKGEGVLIELHWNLICSDHDIRNQSLELMWSHRRQAFLASMHGDQFFQTLVTTAHAAYLSAHLALQHGLTTALLLWAYDLHLLIIKKEGAFNWDEFLEITQEMGWSASVEAALSASAIHFGTPIPLDFQSSLLKSPTPDADLVNLKRQQRTRTTGLLISIKTLDNNLDKVKIILSHLFPDPDFMRYRYQPSPGWLWPLLYVYRWCDIIFDVVRSLRK